MRTAHRSHCLVGLLLSLLRAKHGKHSRRSQALLNQTTNTRKTLPRPYRKTRNTLSAPCFLASHEQCCQWRSAIGCRFAVQQMHCSVFCGCVVVPSSARTRHSPNISERKIFLKIRHSIPNKKAFEGDASIMVKQPSF